MLSSFNSTRAAWHSYKLHFKLSYSLKSEQAQPSQVFKRTKYTKTDLHMRTYISSNIVCNCLNSHLARQAHFLPFPHNSLTPNPFPMHTERPELCRLPCVLWGFTVAFWLSQRRLPKNIKMNKNGNNDHEIVNSWFWFWFWFAFVLLSAQQLYGSEALGLPTWSTATYATLFKMIFVTFI